MSLSYFKHFFVVILLIMIRPLFVYIICTFKVELLASSTYMINFSFGLYKHNYNTARNHLHEKWDEPQILKMLILKQQ